MPANRFNGYTDYGVGIGLRVPHYDHILSKKPIVELVRNHFRELHDQRRLSAQNP